jgi:hypothetical protein
MGVVKQYLIQMEGIGIRPSVVFLANAATELAQEVLELPKISTEEQSILVPVHDLLHEILNWVTVVDYSQQAE